MNENTPTESTRSEPEANPQPDPAFENHDEEIDSDVPPNHPCADEGSNAAPPANPTVPEDACDRITAQVSEEVRQFDPIADTTMMLKLPGYYLLEQTEADEAHDMAMLAVGSLRSCARFEEGWSLSLCAKKAKIKRDRLAKIELGGNPTITERLSLLALFLPPGVPLELLHQYPVDWLTGRQSSENSGEEHVEFVAADEPASPWQSDDTEG